MKKQIKYIGRTELIPHVWCRIDGTARVARTEIRDGIQWILLLDLDLCGDYVDHLWVKSRKALCSNEKVKVEWKVYVYDVRRFKIGLKDVLLSLI